MRAKQTDQPIQITPADREAYLSLNNMPSEHAAKVRAGEWDETAGMQALAARHIEGFLEGQMAMRSRAAGICDQECGDACGCFDAIRSLAAQVYRA